MFRQSTEKKELELTALQQTLKDKSQENGRLKDSFETLKHLNETLKNEVTCWML